MLEKADKSASKRKTMNTKQRIVATAFLALISTAAVRADTIEYSMPENVTTTTSAQTVAVSTWKDVMAGSVVPLSIKARDLDASWRSFTVSEGNDLKSVMLGAYGLSGSNALYSRGDEISVTGETYLVAYRQKTPPMDLTRMNTASTAEKLMRDMMLKPDSTLQLSLLNVRMTSAFNQIQTFDASVFNVNSPMNTVFGEARNNALNASSNSNLKQLMLGVIQYAQDYDEVFPSMQSMYVLKKSIYPYVKTEAIFKQPSNGKFYIPNAALSKKSVASIMNSSELAAIYEADFGSDGKRAVGFADGHVKRVTPAEWTKIKKDSGIK